jgi:hypothetical protein
MSTNDIAFKGAYDMGRKPLGLKQMPIRISESDCLRIDKILGPKRRAVFIRQAIHEKLARDQTSFPHDVQPVTRSRAKSSMYGPATNR